MNNPFTKIVLFAALLIILAFPVKTSCNGRGLCRTGPIQIDGKTVSCQEVQTKPLAFAILDLISINIPFSYTTQTVCD